MNPLFGALRASVFNLGLWLILVAYLPIIGLAALSPAPLRYRMMRPWNWMAVHWLRITCGVRWKIEGEIPKDGLGGHGEQSANG